MSFLRSAFALLLGAVALPPPALAQSFSARGVGNVQINGTARRCVGYMKSPGDPYNATCSPTIPSTDLAPGSAASNLGIAMPTALGAKCDGATVDSAAFNTAIATAKEIALPPGINCLVKDLAITSNQALDCHGSVLTAAAGAYRVLNKSGTNAHIHNCVLNDPTLTTMKSTTLSVRAAPGDTILNVASTTNFQKNMVVSIQLASGAYWTSKITAVGAGTITIADPIPSTVASVSVAAGGSLFTTSQAVVVGGIGPPATLDITAVAGAITAVSLNSPGFYSTTPGAVAAVFSPANSASGAFGGTVNLTYDGAPINNIVDAAFGLLTVDNADDGTTTNILIPEAPVGVQVLGSTGSTTQESFRGISINAAILAGFAKMVNVNDITVREVIASGYIHHASAYGGVGLYIDGRNVTAPTGGNKYDIVTLGFENGLWDMGGTLDIFDNGVFDTSRNNASVCIGCTSTDFNYAFASFTGPNAAPSLGSVGGRGVGMYFGSSAINNSIGKATTQNNATDIHLGDLVSAVWLNNLSQSITSILTGNAFSLQPGFPFMSLPTSASAATLTGTIYLAPGSLSATEGAGSLVQTRGQITYMWVGADVVPGGAVTYTAALRLNHWNGSAYAGAATVASCIIAAASNVCAYGADGIQVFPGDKVDIAITPSAGAFPANQKFTAFVNGI